MGICTRRVGIELTARKLALGKMLRTLVHNLPVYRLNYKAGHKRECCAHANVQSTLRFSGIMECTSDIISHSAFLDRVRVWVRAV
jgi:hypothetical protein